MKRLAGIGFVVAMAMALGGCATTGGAASGTAGGQGLAQSAGPTPQDPNPHGVAMARGDGAFGSGSVRDGTPTPEPAAPVDHETRFAGPTPQIPIPVHGGVRPTIGTY